MQRVFGKLEDMRGFAAKVQDTAARARQHVLVTCQEKREATISVLDELVALNQQLAGEAVDQGEAGAARSTTLALITVVVGVIAAVAFGVFMARAIVRTIRPVVARARAIADGDLTGEQMQVRTKDELGELTTSINQMSDSLQGVISEVTTAAQEVAGASNEIAASSEEMAQGMREQSEQTNQVSSGVEQMSATVVEVARKSAEASDKSGQAGQQAEEGGQVVQETIEGMTSIADVVNESATAINELGRRGEQIGQIIGVINDIADQTNLLALNAAIEAARAGEHGRGFAVVADEVRKLAERTTQATEQVAESIRAIQTETGNAVERMNAGTEQVTLGVEKARQAGTVLQQIVTGSQDVAGMIQSIAGASEEQSAASEQISRNVETISSVTKQSAEGAAQAAAAATQLSTKAEQLQNMVARFRLRTVDSAAG
jgi:methyl-accepting chemotaxis protein